MSLLTSKTLRDVHARLRPGYTRSARTMLITVEGRLLELAELDLSPARVRELLGEHPHLDPVTIPFGAQSTMTLLASSSSSCLSAARALPLNKVASHALALGGVRGVAVHGPAIVHHRPVFFRARRSN